MMSLARNRLLKALTLMLVSITLLAGAGPAKAQTNANLGDQLAGDLVSAGVSVVSAVAGSVPVAMAAGFLTKYLSTYGVAGVKLLIQAFKGKTPQDLGEINLYYIYLLHIKRNLYQALINVRESVKDVEKYGNLSAELEDLSRSMVSSCQEGGCQPIAIDESLVNFEFLNIAIDMKSSLEISRYLGDQEIKGTYQYMILLYLDVIIVEQKLLEGQSNVLATRISEMAKELSDNPYLSNAEKEMQFQMAMNMALRWQLERDHRRHILTQALQKPLSDIEAENDALEDDLADYRTH